MSIPLPDFFGEYDKSIWILPIIIFGYILFQTKNMILIIPLLIYFALFIAYVGWIEEFLIKKKEPKKHITNVLVSMLIFSLHIFYIISILMLIISVDILNEIIGFFLVLLAVLGYIFFFFMMLRIVKPHSKEMLNLGSKIRDSRTKILKIKKGEKLNLDIIKERTKKEIDKLTNEIKKNKK